MCHGDAVGCQNRTLCVFVSVNGVQDIVWDIVDVGERMTAADAQDGLLEIRQDVNLISVHIFSKVDL